MFSKFSRFSRVFLVFLSFVGFLKFASFSWFSRVFLVFLSFLGFLKFAGFWSRGIFWPRSFYGNICIDIASQYIPMSRRLTVRSCPNRNRVVIQTGVAGHPCGITSSILKQECCALKWSQMVPLGLKLSAAALTLRDAFD